MMMGILEFTLLVWLGSLLAGFPGALTGLGGGVVIVPFLTLAPGIDTHYAFAAARASFYAARMKARKMAAISGWVGKSISGCHCTPITNPSPFRSIASITPSSATAAAANPRASLRTAW